MGREALNIGLRLPSSRVPHCEELVLLLREVGIEVMNEKGCHLLYHPLYYPLFHLFTSYLSVDHRNILQKRK
jgi:hypothetical protein